MRTMEGKRVTVGMILRLITTDVGLNKYMYDIRPNKHNLYKILYHTVKNVWIQAPGL